MTASVTSEELSNNIHGFISNLLTFDNVPAYITDKSKLKEEIYALLTPRWLRFRPVEEEIKELIVASIAKSVDENKPIEILNAMGGFKNYRIDTAPHIDYAEVFHLSFFTHVLERVCSIYEPGVHLEYSGDAHMACIVDNIKKEWVDQYILEFNQLLELFDSHTPSNFRITHKHFLDFYDFDEMKLALDEATKNEKLDDPKNDELITAYYPRAKSNFCVNGNEDFSGLSDKDLEQKIKMSVIRAYKWYDLDFEKRGDYFASFIGVCNLSEFPESYCLRSVRFLPAPAFWQGKGVIQVTDENIVPTILSVNQYVAIKDELPEIAITNPPLDIETLRSLQLYKQS